MVDASLVHKKTGNGNNKIALGLVVFIVGMVGLTYAAVPLYQAFCAATGFDGATIRATGNVKGVIARRMTTQLDATVAPGLPLRIAAADVADDRIGTERTLHITARNTSDKTITMRAEFNVTPALAGGYFKTVKCFCFKNQTLKPGETRDLPVTFFVDPDLDKFDDLRTVSALTLSYTFYAVDNGGS